MAWLTYPTRPSSQPLITMPVPRVKLKGELRSWLEFASNHQQWALALLPLKHIPRVELVAVGEQSSGVVHLNCVASLGKNRAFSRLGNAVNDKVGGRLRSGESGENDSQKRDEDAEELHCR